MNAAEFFGLGDHMLASGETPEEASLRTGLSKARCSEARRAAMIVEPTKRIPGVTPDVYLFLANKPEAEKWAGLAAKNGWGVTRLKREMNGGAAVQDRRQQRLDKKRIRAHQEEVDKAIAMGAGAYFRKASRHWQEWSAFVTELGDMAYLCEGDYAKDVLAGLIEHFIKEGERTMFELGRPRRMPTEAPRRVAWRDAGVEVLDP